MGRLPLRGRLPRYRRVDDTSVMFAAICFPGDQVMQREGLDWTVFEAGSRRSEATGEEWHGEWQPYRGRTLGGGLVWDADGLRLAVGKSVEEGPVAGLSFWVPRLVGWVGGFGYGFGFRSDSWGQARDAQQGSKAASSSQSKPFSAPVGPDG